MMIRVVTDSVASLSQDLVEDLNIVSKLEYDSQPMNIETIQVVPFARGIVADYLNTGID